MMYEGKPIVDFHTDNHIPIALTREGIYIRIRDPKDIVTRTYLEILFEPFIKSMLEGRLNLTYEKLLMYQEKFVRDKPIPEKSKFHTRQYNFVIIVGVVSEEKLTKLESVLLSLNLDPALPSDIHDILTKPA